MASPNFNQIDGPEAFKSAFGVSRETIEKLSIYEALLKRWQKTMNLVAPSTLDHIWHRHFADSAQLLLLLPPRGGGREGGNPDGQKSGFPPTGAARHLPHKGGGEVSSPSPGHGEAVPSARGGGGFAEPAHWLDLGSGAGFPGMVLAIMAAETGQTRHTLIESDSRKAAFLAEVARQTSVAVDILCARIELRETSAKVGLVDCVTARALAPLPKLVNWAAPYFASHTSGIFMKGQSVKAELEETSLSWDFAADLKPSVTDPSGAIVLLTALKSKTEG